MLVLAAEHPGGVVYMQGVVAETQLLRGPVSDFLGQVHEGGGGKDRPGVGLVARDAKVLAELISFLTDGRHTLLV